MSDYPNGPGWWQASDGRWYPPEQHPDAMAAQAPPAPPGFEGADHPGWAAPWPPPAPPRRSARWPWVAAVVAIAAALVVVALVVGRSSSTSSSDASGSDRSGAAGAPVRTIPVTGEPVTARGGDVSLVLPDGWRGVSIEGGTAGLGRLLVPDDPASAARVEQSLQALPRAVVLFGLDPSALGSSFVSNVNVLPDPTAPLSADLEQIGSAELRGVDALGGSVKDAGLIDLDGRQVYFASYDTAVSSGVAYVFKGSDDVWVVTYSFRKGDVDLALTAGSAATFVAP